MSVRHNGARQTSKRPKRYAILQQLYYRSTVQGRSIDHLVQDYDMLRKEPLEKSDAYANQIQGNLNG